MARVHQTAFQFDVVLNDAIVDHGNSLLTVGMGMSVLIRRAPVSRPSCVAEAHGAIWVWSAANIIKAVDFANGLSHLDVALGIDYGDAGAVIAPVLQPP